MQQRFANNHRSAGFQLIELTARREADLWFSWTLMHQYLDTSLGNKSLNEVLKSDKLFNEVCLPWPFLL